MTLFRLPDKSSVLFLSFQARVWSVPSCVAVWRQSDISPPCCTTATIVPPDKLQVLQIMKKTSFILGSTVDLVQSWTWKKSWASTWTSALGSHLIYSPGATWAHTPLECGALSCQLKLWHWCLHIQIQFHIFTTVFQAWNCTKPRRIFFYSFHYSGLV